MTTTTNTNDANKALVLAGIKGVFIDRDPTVLDRLGMSKTPGTGTGYFSLVPPPYRGGPSQGNGWRSWVRNVASTLTLSH
jgi:hypothetical protein